MKHEVLSCDNCPLYVKDYDYGDFCNHPKAYVVDSIIDVGKCPLAAEPLELYLPNEETRLKKLKAKEVELAKQQEAELKELEKKRNKAEAEFMWQCVFCGTVQPDSYDEGCDKCGASNSFLIPLEGKV